MGVVTTGIDFNLIRWDRDRHGGGVAIYTHDSIPFSIRSKHPDIVLLMIDLKLKRSNLTCGLFYRPLSSDPSVLSRLESTLEELPPSLSESLLLLGVQRRPPQIIEPYASRQLPN